MRARPSLAILSARPRSCGEQIENLASVPTVGKLHEGVDQLDRQWRGHVKVWDPTLKILWELGAKFLVRAGAARGALGDEIKCARSFAKRQPPGTHGFVDKQPLGLARRGEGARGVK